MATDTEIEVSETTSETPEKKDVKTKKRKARKSGSSGSSIGLMVGVLVVGICLLCVSVVGMIGVSSDLSAQTETTTAGTVAQDNVATPEVTTVSPDVQVDTGNQVENTTLAPVNGNDTANNDDNSSSSSAPSTNEEWLAFFNTAVNKLKTEVPAMTKAKQTKTADIQLSNSLGQAYVSAAKDKYLSDEVVETPIAKGDKSAAVANVSPDGEAYVSNLTMSDVKSVSGTVDASGNYIITIAMNDMSNPDLSSSYAKIFEFMTVDDVMDTYAPNMGATVDRANVELKFSNCSATATVTPDGKVISYQTTVNANMILKDAKISVITTDLDATLFSETKYTNISW